MYNTDDTAASMVSFEANVLSDTVFLLLLVYHSPVFREMPRGLPGLAIRVFLNPYDVSAAFGLLPDGSHVELRVGRPDYATGRSLANHLENIERLKRFKRSGSRDRSDFTVLPKDPEDRERAARVVMPPELMGRKRSPILSERSGAERGLESTFSLKRDLH